MKSAMILAASFGLMGSLHAARADFFSQSAYVPTFTFLDGGGNSSPTGFVYSGSNYYEGYGGSPSSP